MCGVAGNKALPINSNPRFPVSPRIAKMLTVAREHPESLPYAVALCAALTVGNMFVVEADVRAEGEGEGEAAGDSADEDPAADPDEQVWAS
jgi:HrpA-like RNA helicase